MPPEEKHKINVWIPESLWKQIGSLGYESPTKATIAAFEALVLQEEKGSNQEALGSSQEDLRKLQEENRKFQEIIEDLKEDLARAPDLVTFAQLQARYEGLQLVLTEKDRSIERLESDLQKAGQREEDLKQLHNNYMLQVQSLINARALSAPSGSMTTKEAHRKKEEVSGSNQEENRKFQEESKPEESRPAEKEESQAAEKYHTGEGEKDLIKKICKNCNQPFLTANPKKETCSDKCRSSYSRKKKN